MDRAASNGWVSFPAEGGAARETQSRISMSRWGLADVAAGLGTVAAVTLAAILTVIFAATLVVAVVLTGALVGVYALTHRRRPQGVLIEARRVGHSWVAYGWDQRPR